MAKLKSMAYTKAEQKDRNSPKECSVGYSGGDKYPYGLRLDLNNQSLDKLGLESLPKPGTKMTLTAEVEVVGARQSSRVGAEPDRSIELQIVKLGLESAGSAVDALDAALAEMDDDNDAGSEDDSDGDDE